MTPESQSERRAMSLLKAIFEKTGGRSRGVRDITELETGLTEEQSKTAWRDLLAEDLIERFSKDYAARLSVRGLEFIQSAPPFPEPTMMRDDAPKVLIVHGPGTEAQAAIAEFVGELGLFAVPLSEPAEQGPSTMQQVEAQGEGGFVVVLLATQPGMGVLMELGYFMGRFGRTRVCVFALNGEVKLPAELAGVALETFDASGAWKPALRRFLSDRL